MGVPRSSECRAGSIDPPSPRRRAVGVATGMAIAIAWGVGRAEDGNPADPPEARTLFDGKSLEGWGKTGFSHPGEVMVEDGALVMAAGRPMTGITSTRRDLPATDYELSYEAMRLSGSDFFAAATFPVGKGHVTLVNGGWGGSVTGLSSLDGADASENETTRSVKYANRTWYRFRIRVTDAAIRCRVDDKEVVAIDHRGRKLATRIEVRANQPLGFAAWESGGAVRRVQVRRLTPAEVAVAGKFD